MEKDDPWQFLAACMEFTDALLSGLPIVCLLRNWQAIR